MSCTDWSEAALTAASRGQRPLDICKGSALKYEICFLYQVLSNTTQCRAVFSMTLTVRAPEKSYTVDMIMSCALTQDNGLSFLLPVFFVPLLCRIRTADIIKRAFVSTSRHSVVVVRDGGGGTHTVNTWSTCQNRLSSHQRGSPSSVFLK